jgi:hypothetical protein
MRRTVKMESVMMDPRQVERDMLTTYEGKYIGIGWEKNAIVKYVGLLWI